MFKPRPEEERCDTRLLVLLPRPLRRDVEALANRDGRSLSDVGREALAAYVEAQTQNGTGEKEK